MSHTEILKQLRELPPIERLALIEEALQETRRELQQRQDLPPDSDMTGRMVSAAQALYADYATDRELTAFTALGYLIRKASPMVLISSPRLFAMLWRTISLCCCSLR